MSDGTYGTISLGDDYDCDTCGWTCNEVEWSWDGQEYALRATVGCYGGESLDTTDPDEACAFIANWTSRFPESQWRAEAEMGLLRRAAGTP